MSCLDRLLQWSSQRIGQKKAMQERFGRLLALYQDYIPSYIIKVAGTNGKGSVSASLSSCLKSAGKKVGLFTSPHLVHVKERFRIKDQEVSEEQLEKAALRVEQRVLNWVSEQGSEMTPSFFELLILIALELFKEEGVEIAVFEAGVGGHNDATSLLPSIFSMLTSVGLDHQAQLGNSLESVALDKAGICPNGGLLLMNASLSSYLQAIISKELAARNAKARVLSSRVSEYSYDLVQAQSNVVLEDGTTLKLKPQLKGEYQAENLNLVLGAWEELINLSIVHSWQPFIEGLSKVHWPARFEIIGQNPIYLLDSAHNPPAMAALVQALDKLSKKEDRILVFGNSEEKDYQNIIPYCAAIADQVFLVDDFYKAIPSATLANAFTATMHWQNEGASTIKSALDLVQANYPDKLVVVAGSIFMVGLLRDELLAKKR